MTQGSKKESKAYFKCDHCGALLSSQKMLDKHTCEPKRRYETHETMEGRAAYMVFTKWLRYRKCSDSAMTKKKFIESRYYNSMFRFVEWSKKMSICDKNAYIRFMVKNNILPTLWCSRLMHEMYMEHFDNIHTIESQGKITARTIHRLSEAIGCEYTEVFKKVGTRGMITLITSRNLSPWILLTSKTFYRYLQDLHPNERITLESIISPKYWGKKLEKDPEAKARAKKIVAELKL